MKIVIDCPCNVGDTVWFIRAAMYKSPYRPQIEETTVEKIIITAKGIKVKLACNSTYETSVSSFGKSVFVTELDAQLKLKELNNIQ